MRKDGRNPLAARRHGPAANPDGIVAQTRLAGQPGQAPAPAAASSGQYGFLAAAGIGRAAIAHAEAEAHRLGVAAHEVLLAAGAVGPDTYASALAAYLGVPHADWNARFDLRAPEDADGAAELGIAARIAGEPCRALCAEDGTPEAVAGRIAAVRGRGLTAALASRRQVDAAVAAVCRAERIDRAVYGMLRQRPACSAGGQL